METITKEIQQLQTKNENLINFVNAITGKITGNVTMVKEYDKGFETWSKQTIKICFNENRSLFQLITSLSDVFDLNVGDVAEAISTGKVLSYETERYTFNINYKL